MALKARIIFKTIILKQIPHHHQFFPPFLLTSFCSFVLCNRCLKDASTVAERTESTFKKLMIENLLSARESNRRVNSPKGEERGVS